MSKPGSVPALKLVDVGRWGRSCALVACTAGSLFSRQAALATTQPTPWGTNGTVLAIATAGNTVYLGGTFSVVGPATGSGTVVSPLTAEPLESSPEIAGTTRAVVPDGIGGWFVGGTIVGAGGAPYNNLVHIGQDGSVVPWHPVLDGPVFTLACSGQTLYVGGDFHSVDNVSRNALAAFDVRSGRLLEWNPDADGIVLALQPALGSVFVGGQFTRVGGAERRCLAKVDEGSGGALAWRSDTDNTVLAFALAKDTLYVGGYFTSIGGATRSLLAAVDVMTGITLGFDPKGVSEPLSDFDAMPSGVNALAVIGGSLFVGGHFVGMGGEARIGLVEIDRLSGLASSWAPSLGPIYPGWPTPSVRSLQICSNGLVAGGDFTTIDGQPRGRAAQFRVSDGLITPWDPRANDVVYALGADCTHVFMGGGFTTQWAWQVRRGLAAIDATTGSLLPWNPPSDVVTITALAAGSGKVYISGLFSTLGGQPRSNIAAVDAVTGLAAPWNPQANDVAMSMVLSGAAVYAGGMFTSIGGAPRAYVAKLDTTTGAASAWSADCDDWVTSLLVRGDKVFLGGWFRNAGGQNRSRLAAADTSDGAITAWAPDADGPVSALAAGDSIVAVGGAFRTIGGAAHAGLAVLDEASGAAKGWNVDVGDGVTTLAVSSGELFVAGDFAFIGGKDRLRVAAVNVRSGAIEDWHLDADGVVWTSVARERGVWLGGAFTVAGSTPAPGIIGVDGPSSQIPGTGASLLLAQSAPNPARESANIRFELPADAVGSLSIFDLAGRRVSSLLSATFLPAGRHEVTVSTAGWSPGCYFYRLEIPGARATRKMLVVK